MRRSLSTRSGWIVRPATLTAACGSSLRPGTPSEIPRMTDSNALGGRSTGPDQGHPRVASRRDPHEVERGVTSPLRTVVDRGSPPALRRGAGRSPTRLCGAECCAPWTSRGQQRARKAPGGLASYASWPIPIARQPTRSSRVCERSRSTFPGVAVVPQVGVLVAGGLRVVPDLLDVSLGLVLEARQSRLPHWPKPFDERLLAI